MTNSLRIQPKEIITIGFVILVSICLFVSAVIAQTIPSSTVTQVTSVSSTSTLLTTITSSSTNYTTTTEKVNSTVGIVKTSVQAFTTVTSTYYPIASATVTVTISNVITQVSTQTTQLLGNIWGESLALVLAIGAVISFLVPKIHSRKPKGVVCSKCGYRNPPFARGFCVKCGHPLKET